jgi:hypothetical protein
MYNLLAFAFYPLLLCPQRSDTDLVFNVLLCHSYLCYHLLLLLSRGFFICSVSTLLLLTFIYLALVDRDSLYRIPHTSGYVQTLNCRIM